MIFNLQQSNNQYYGKTIIKKKHQMMLNNVIWNDKRSKGFKVIK